MQVSAAFFGANNVNLLRTANTGHLTLSDDKLSVSCEGLSMKALNKEATSYSVLLTHPREITASFTFERIHRGFKAGRHENGRMPHGAHFLHANEGPTTCHRFYPFGKITSGMLNVLPEDGSAPISIDLKDSRALFIHASIDGMLPYQLADHFNTMLLQTDNSSLVMLQFRTPKKQGGESIAFGCLALGDKIVAIPLENSVAHTEVATDPDNGYAVPKRIRFQWEGVMLGDKKKFSAVADTKIGKAAQRIDILSHLPYIIRAVIQALVTKPFIYQWAEDVTASVSMGDEEITLSGRAMIECSFLN